MPQSVSATEYMRMFWAEYLTHYGVDGLLAAWEKVTIRQRPLLSLQLSVRVGGTCPPAYLRQ